MLYDYLDETPKTSLVVEIVEKLHEFGYEIKKKELWKYLIKRN